MRPKKHKTTGLDDLFRARLDQIINMKHELVQLAGKVGTGSAGDRATLQRERPAWHAAIGLAAVRSNQ
jgi:hypothetical protein